MKPPIINVHVPQCGSSQDLSYVGVCHTNIHAYIYFDEYHSNIQAGLASKDKFEPSSPKWRERYLFTYSFIHL